MSYTKTTLAAYGLGLSLLFGITSCQVAISDPDDGARYLEEKGYRNVQGGDNWTYFNTCGKNVLSRDYTVTTPEGKQGVEKTVCFSLLFGRHEPLL